MNHHELVDLATISVSALALRGSTFFSRSLDSPPIGDVVTDASLALDSFETEGRRTVTVDTPVGEFRAAYLPWRWDGMDAPTLLFHHGSGEDPFDVGRFGSNSFRRLFVAAEWDLPVNLVAVRAPFHDGSSLEYARAMGDLDRFVGMCATSTALVDALTEELHSRGCPAVVVSGISLGGWVTNLHRAFLGSADRYVPMFAGAALGELFTTSVYRKMTGERARANPQRLRDTLDFEDAFVENTTDDCAPLLARYDRIVEFDTQRRSYEGFPLAVVEKGHVTGSLASTRLRDHVREAVEQVGRE